MILRTPVRRGAALTLAASAALALSACGSSESASNTASNAVSAAGTAASKAGDAASAGATNATSAVAGAASDASTAASAGASNASSAASAGTTPQYTLADVQKHASETDCWAAIKAPGETTTGVYNLTSWIANHPGGPEAIKGLCGTDATQKFLGKHGEDGAQGAPEKRLATFKVGELKG